MLRKCLSIIFKLSVLIGLLLVIGTAGSSDLGLIDIESLAIRMGVGIFLVAFGFIGLKLLNVEYMG